MYLTSLKLLNTGPISKLNIECGFHSDGSPKPVIIVGKNGTGKTIAIAHIVSAIISAHSSNFDDADVERGKVFKLRSPEYVRHGTDHSVGEVQFSNGFFVREAQLNKPKSEFADDVVDYSDWASVPEDEMSHLSSNVLELKKAIKKDLGAGTHIYFPPNRFEEPAWLNELNLKNKVEYTSLKRYSNYSNRPTVIHSPMRDIQSWLLDLIYDSYAVERKLAPQPSYVSGLPARLLEVRDGPASRILASVEEILQIIFDRNGSVGWSVGMRNSRQIGVSIENTLVTQNVFGLSTGQAVLLDLFLSIVRDFDLSHSNFSSLSDVNGIVIIDEIDLHLHADLQHSTLPSLIKLFPNVQFIVTTHSPLFLMGIQKTHLSNGTQIFEFPNGDEIAFDRFSEFEIALNYMRETTAFQNELRERVAKSHRPTRYMEGTTDIDYLRRAAEHLDQSELLNKFEIVDAVGTSHLDKIWDAYKSHLYKNLTKPWILLYDCDTKRENTRKGNLSRRILPQQPNMITSGIENLFSDITIKAAIKDKASFIDITSKHQRTLRGKTVDIAEEWKINKDEKRNLCNWICKNGKSTDFSSFMIVFDILHAELQNG